MGAFLLSGVPWRPPKQAPSQPGSSSPAAGLHHHRQQAAAQLGIAAAQLHLAFEAHIAQPFMRLLQPALARAAELRKQLCPARFVFAIGKQADGAAVRRAPHRRQRTAVLVHHVC
ncbi:hypothetical protein G6F50_016528 [Rhizopus delemar]|uniref:Uncharacterized protein n=1 Tax=Rhizopus delemar TaxID=936053 RepID=A0A9P6XTC4_9FUNG|nr:hypothetical protein G6F50_016528 [Rhizopus delemar]